MRSLTVTAIRLWLTGLVALILLSAPAVAAQPADPLGRGAAFALIALEPAGFERAWDERRTAALPTATDPLERAALTARWAQGYLDYDYFRWRETGQVAPADWPARATAIAAVDRNDPALLALPAHQAFMGTWIRAEVRRLLRSDPGRRVGNVVWLNTAFEVVEQTIQNPAVRDALLGQTLLTFIDENGAKGVQPLIERFDHAAVDRAAVAAVWEAWRPQQAAETGHPVEAYKAVGGVDLDVHIFRPANAPTERAPAILWFHGGSGDTGAWSQCPAFCQRFRELGLVVLQVEYRTYQRFDSTPLDALADARSAVRWARTNAARLGLDANRIAVAGFSTGATLAAQTLTVDGFDDPDDDLTVRAQSDAAVMVSGCYAPETDAYYRRVLEGSADLASLSPAARARPGLPPSLVIHGGADRVCEFDAAERFVTTAAGSARLTALPDQSHFFVFSSPPARREALDATTAFLTEVGWVDRPVP
ncbi:MAG: alpha/beta hydrolase [Brevundimonas sp.]|uniref:alpha/beta hydrolase n=1 Tax=Brevundimonas sp. TaxID=1871086 RepID=UPI0027336939|nr:alpha/beta hydrolase [Brevundimonas sp.]MDP3403049.1 alpha/beta hydrolase [Brevundimonas sp.]